MTAILKEPYRVWVPLALGFSLFGLGVWTVYWLFPQWGYPYYPHVSLQMRTIMPLFVFGILLTLLPKLLHLSPLKKWEFFLFTLCFTLNFIASLWVLPLILEISYGVCLLLLCYFFYARKAEVAVSFPKEFYMLHLAFFCNIATSLIRILYELHISVPSALERFASRFQNQGFIFLIFLSVGSFLIPKMFLSPDYVALYLEKLKSRKKSSGFKFVALGILFCTSYLIESFISPLALSYRLAASLRLALIFYLYSELFMAFRWPAQLPQILKWGWTALWCIPLSQLAIFIYPVEYISWDHILYISGIFLITFSIGAKILSGHANDSGLIKKYPRAIFSFGFFFMLGMSTRVSCFFVKSYEMHLGVSALCVLISIGIWAKIYLPKTVEIPSHMQ